MKTTLLFFLIQCIGLPILCMHDITKLEESREHVGLTFEHLPNELTWSILSFVIIDCKDLRQALKIMEPLSLVNSEFLTITRDTTFLRGIVRHFSFYKDNRLCVL